MPKGICYNASRQERRKCSLWHAKSPGGRNSGAFLFRCGKVAYALGWLPPIYLRPAICRCSRRLHLPRQRVRKDLKERCNEQSREQGLHVPEKGKTFAGEVREETVAWSKDTYQLLKQAEQGKVKSYVQDIALAVLDCKETATSRETFIRLMNERGYGVDWQDSHKYITYTDLAREQAGEKACKIRDNKLEKYYNMDFGKESMEHEFERNARTAEAEQSKRAASRVKPTEPDRAGKQSAQRSVGDVERELRGIDEAVKSRTSKGRAEQAERRRAEQEAHQRAEAERRAAEEQQRIASRRYIGRDWEPER